ncbi:unnamed protein product [Mytilus coruscus]|uniref:Zinc finger PHD-type domain-containing protein n=1 Tax=Mytilus coruscus TaxID=42192 RepID=A0A6J8EDR8_MYTCO|nr:unnamed protein product [Mytilus coruscus]
MAGLGETSSTSKACKWNSTFRKEVTPTTITDIFEHIKGRRVKDVCSVQATGSAPLPAPEVIDDLYSLIPTAAFFTSATAPSQIQEPQLVTKTDKFPKLLTTFQDTDNDPNDLDLKLKCNRFIQDYVVKELITRDLENQPCHNLSTTKDDKNNETETWCLCSKPKYGRMIKCENLECPYHYKCVNIRRKPRGKWYCFNCEQ